MKHLNVRELNLAIHKKQEKRKASFEKVLQQCYSRIQGFADKEHKHCFYEVPEFIIGFPLYDISECVTYISEVLGKNGFSISYYFPRVLYISWGSEEKKTKQMGKTMQASVKTIQHKKSSEFLDSVKEFRPSGKFVLNLT